MTTRCIICLKSCTEIWAKKDNYTAIKCKNCNLVWIDPLPKKEELNDFYIKYYSGRKEEKILWEQRKLMYKLDQEWLEQFIKEGKILDVGCSDGSFLLNFGEKWDKYGVEIGADAVKEANKKNLKVIEGSIEEAKKFEEKFDCITLRGVIEHFINPDKVIEIASSLLKENGYLFITATPNISSFCAEIYREKWNQFSPPGHLFYFNAKNFTKLVENYSFKKIAENYFYSETPYANIIEDHQKVLNDCNLMKNNNREKITVSPPFWGNMMTLLFKKDTDNNILNNVENKRKIILTGETINIVPFFDQHLHHQNYLSWLHDYNVIKYLNLPDYLAKQVTFEEVKKYIETKRESNNLFFKAIETKEGKFIGTFKIGPIDWHAKNVNLGIMIGDQSYWGKGIAKEAFRLGIEFCFNELKMHKITGGCMEPNISMVKVFEGLGFKREGCFREQDFFEEKFSNHLHFGLFKNEYK